VNTAQRIGSGLAVLVLFAAAMWIKSQEVPLQHAATAPIGPTGRVGEIVANRLFSVKVDKYEVAKSVMSSGGSILGGSKKEVRTDHIFLIVYARVRASREPLAPSKPKLKTGDGLMYAESDRIRATGDIFRTYQPQMWYNTVISFELPKDQLEGARLFIDNRKFIDLLPAKVEIDLGIDRATADRLSARPREAYEVKVAMPPAPGSGEGPRRERHEVRPGAGEA
jgi:hypothetical protein